MTDQAAPQLTPRELEVLRLLCSGLTTYATLSAELIVSPHTVHYHLEQIRMKLGVTNQAQIVGYAHAHGLIGDDLQWRGGANVA